MIKKAKDATGFIALCHKPLAIVEYLEDDKTHKKDAEKWLRTSVSQGKIIRLDHKWAGCKTLGEGKTLISTAGLASAINADEAPLFGGKPHAVNFDPESGILRLTHTLTDDALAENPAISEAWQSMNIAAQAMDLHSQWAGEQIYLYNEQHGLSLVYWAMSGKVLDRMLKEVGAVERPSVDDSPRVEIPAEAQPQKVEPEAQPEPVADAEPPAPTIKAEPVRKMLGEYTYEQMLEAGWTDATLIEHGHMELVEPEPEPAPSAPVVEEPTRKMLVEHTYEQMLEAGWTDETLLAHGHMELTQPVKVQSTSEAYAEGDLTCPACASQMTSSAGVIECLACGHMDVA